MSAPSREELRALLASVLEQHLPESYGDHGCSLRCGWSDEGTLDSAAEHLADALLAGPLAALLDAADEADRLREAVEALAREWEMSHRGIEEPDDWYGRHLRALLADPAPEGGDRG